MPVFVADTGPLRYLVLIGEIGILPRLVDKVLIPSEVGGELSQPQTPPAVRAWIGAPPAWLRVQPAPDTADAALARLNSGERAAIALALSIGADAVLMDDRAGVAVALANGLGAIGTLGVLDRAARRGMIDLETAFTRLRATNFRYSPALLDATLAAWRKDRGA